MGIEHGPIDLPAFTAEHVRDRGLVLRMLRHEDALIHGPVAHAMNSAESMEPRTSLLVVKTLQRMVLTRFGFANDDGSLHAYRGIFRAYFNDVGDYDAEVVSAVTYMRENRCIFYARPELPVGSCAAEAARSSLVHPVAPEAAPETLDAVLARRFAAGDSHVFVGAFSTS
jgi:hypothetical protein